MSSSHPSTTKINSHLELILEFYEWDVYSQTEVFASVENLFKDFPSLEKDQVQKINLSSFHFKTLPRYLEDFKNLEELDLSGNFITNLEEIPPLPQLTTLIATKNSIKNLSKAFFDKFPRLKKLELFDNPIQDEEVILDILPQKGSFRFNQCKVILFDPPISKEENIPDR